VAQIVLLNPQIILNSVDLTGRIDMVSIDESFAEVDTTAFGQTAKRRVAGLGDNKVTIEFQQDFTAAEVDQTINPLLGTITSLTVKPLNAATSSVNPAYVMNVLVNQYKPVDGKVGDLSKASLTWPVDGTVTRATS
jgi:hypothetical protein